MTDWLSRGLLPNLARLAADGAFRPLATTTPAESPVAWSAFSVCAGPGKTGIFDFLIKAEGSYDPVLALAHEASEPFYSSPLLRWGLPAAAGAVLGGAAFGVAKAARARSRRALLAALPVGAAALAGSLYLSLDLVPDALPRAVSDRMGTDFWTVAGRAGVPSAILEAPVCFPAESVPNGRLLSGLGVPDIRKSWGTSTLFDSAATGETDTEMGGKLVGIAISEGVAETYVAGPPNILYRDERPVRLPIRLKIDQAAGKVTIIINERTETIGVRQWSKFFSMRFRLNAFAEVRGLGRFFLTECGPSRVRLYLSPISFDPEHPVERAPIAQPPEYGAELARAIGPYKTLGWAADTWALNTGFLDEAAFLDDAYDLMKQNEAMLDYELKRADWQLLFILFQATDFIQHMFMRFLDRTHPMYDAALAERYADTILKAYQAADAVVGRVRARLKRDDVLLIVSDHGFASFAKAVNLNTYFVQKGLMTLKGKDPVRDRNLADLFGKGEFWPNVDWGRTNAFALGLSPVYLNVMNREPEGAVYPGRDFNETRAKVVQALQDLRDPQTGKPVIHSVTVPEDDYTGPGMDRAPDLTVNFERGYRISWQTALGGIPKDVIEPNLTRWSGDHCSVAAPLLPGVLFSSRALAAGDARLIDIGTTALDLLGVPADSQMEGGSLI